MKIFSVFLFIFYSALSFADSHKIEKIDFEHHTYICFDDHFFVHDPECRKCAFTPQVIFQKDSTDIEDKSKLPFIMMRLDASPYHRNSFPGLYYYIED